MKKYLLALSMATLLSGCVSPTKVSRNTVGNTLPQDFNKFCYTTMTEVPSGTYMVTKGDQRNFYMTPEGTIYSRAELDNIAQQNNSVNVDSMKNMLKGQLNSVIGMNVFQQTQSVDITKVKTVVVRQFHPVKKPGETYCIEKLEENDVPEDFTSEKYKMVLTHTTASNSEFYSDTNQHNVMLYPIK